MLICFNKTVINFDSVSSFSYFEDKSIRFYFGENLLENIRIDFDSEKIRDETISSILSGYSNGLSVLQI